MCFDQVFTSQHIRSVYRNLMNTHSGVSVVDEIER